LAVRRSRQPDQHLELDRGEAVLGRLAGQPRGQAGVRLGEQADGGDARIVEEIVVHVSQSTST
jgi:hypothetical protein